MSASPPAWKVVTQYHSAGEKVYELASGSVTLELRISSQLVAGERSWHVAAQSDDSTSISESADTKSSALTKVAEQWAARTEELSLPVLDWTHVPSALLAVRAI